MRTFASEAKRVVKQAGLGEPQGDRLGELLCWTLFRMGEFRKCRRRSHGKRPWTGRQRAFRGARYEPHTGKLAASGEATSGPSPVVASPERMPEDA